MMNAARFREKAALCRHLAATATTAETAERMRALADDYDESALRFERKRLALKQANRSAAGR
jgi:hypothetical protein